jgi:tRNA(fMet)-specific endonuclease VapC
MISRSPATRSQGLVVVTGNLAEFRRVDGLRSEDWLAEGH